MKMHTRILMVLLFSYLPSMGNDWLFPVQNSMPAIPTKAQVLLVQSVDLAIWEHASRKFVMRFVDPGIPFLETKQVCIYAIILCPRCDHNISKLQDEGHFLMPRLSTQVHVCPFCGADFVSGILLPSDVAPSVSPPLNTGSKAQSANGTNNGLTNHRTEWPISHSTAIPTTDQTPVIGGYERWLKI